MGTARVGSDERRAVSYTHLDVYKRQALTRAYDRTVKQLDLLQNRKMRNEPTEAVSAPPPITSLRSSDPTRAVPIALKDFHLLEEMLRQPPLAERAA